MMSAGSGGFPGEDSPGRVGGAMGSASPSWKVYDNPFYIHHHQRDGHRGRHPCFGTQQHPYYSHAARLPISARKLTASIWDVDASALLHHHLRDPFSAGGATPDLHVARARIRELKAELELERRLRKKAETHSRTLAREAAQERVRREAEEITREGLAQELARTREEAGELRREVEEERRRRVRMVESMREDRVQMKLAEARALMEERLLDLRCCSPRAGEDQRSSWPKAIPAAEEEEPCCGEVIEDGRGGDGEVADGGSSQQRRGAENPHIRRGIKGFVEFPKMGRARAGRVTGPREGKWDPGSKLECQMAQLRVLLRNRVPAGLSSSASANLVM